MPRHPKVALKSFIRSNVSRSASRYAACPVHISCVPVLARVRNGKVRISRPECKNLSKVFCGPTPDVFNQGFYLSLGLRVSVHRFTRA